MQMPILWAKIVKADPDNAEVGKPKAAIQSATIETILGDCLQEISVPGGYV